MQRLGKRNTVTFISVFLLIILALVCHALARKTEIRFLSTFLNFIRTYIYIGTFAAWGLSVSKRIIHKQVKKTLTAVSVLAIMWIALREVKFRFITSAFIIRLLWYSYYIPHLIIPVLAIIVSLYIGKNESYRLKKSSALLYIPSLTLIALIMTNDYHQLAFRFPESSAVWTERDYAYGPVFYITAAWIGVCALVSLAILIIKTRIPQNRKLFWLPLIPFAVSVVYTVLYPLRLTALSYIDDMAVFFCLMYISYFELCIQCSLIQSNTGYSSLFAASVDVPVSITDSDYNTVFKASAAGSYDKSVLTSAAEKPVILDSGVRIHNIPINGGHAIWTEDLSEILSLKETLEDRRDELKERNALLEYEYQKEKEHKTVEEQNRLYDLLQSKTQLQLDKIDRLMQTYRLTDDKDEKRTILSEIVVLGSYIKRRKDFILSLDITPDNLKGKLSSSLGESYRSLKLLGIKGSYLVNPENASLSLENVTKAYDFFESVVEATLQKAKYINTSICSVNGELRITVLTDIADTDITLNNRFADCDIISDGDSTAFVLKLTGGDGK